MKRSVGEAAAGDGGEKAKVTGSDGILF